MFRFKPKDRKARAGPRRGSAYLGTDERAGRDYFLSGPHVYFVGTAPPGAPPPSGAGGHRTASPCVRLAAYNRQQKALRRPAKA